MKRNHLRILLLALAIGAFAAACDDEATTGSQDVVETDTTGEDVDPTDTTTGDTTEGDTTAGDTTAGDTTAGDTTAGDTTAGDTTAGDTTAGDTTAGDTTAGDTTAGDATGDAVGDTTAGDAAGDATAGDAAGDTVTLAGLGEACAEGAECDSTYCFDSADTAQQVCSECGVAEDCGAGFNCVFDSSAGYGVCVGNLGLGDACDGDAQCVSGSCNTSVCSECNADGDCTDGGACTDDTAGSGYFVCAGGLGDLCVEPGDCASGECFDAGGGNLVCSECTVTSDCGVSQDCSIGEGAAYATCIGTGALGDNCDSGDQCTPGTFCTDGSCSECAGDSDCTDGGLCQVDTDLGYSICSGGLGDDCTDGSECSSTYCFTQGDASVCSDCALTTDCGLQQECAGNPDLGYAVCVGTGTFGANCQDESQCEPGLFCTDGACSQCATDADCPNAGVCAVGSSGFSLCQYENGADCAIGEQCLSTYCWDGQGPDVCGECTQDSDCGAGGNCSYGFGDAFPRCVGDGALGSDCTAGSDCASGVCTDSVCSECGVATDCAGDGAACVDDTAGSGYWICEDGLGALCETADTCASGFCFETGFGPSFCSECEVDGDCAENQACEGNVNDGYASCVGNAGLGESCGSDADCAPVCGFNYCWESSGCNGGTCALCTSDSDCGEGGTCADHTGVGFAYCNGLGDRGCDVGEECASGFCHDRRGPEQCAECENDGDCGQNGSCNFDSQVGYHTCQ